MHRSFARTVGFATAVAARYRRTIASMPCKFLPTLHTCFASRKIDQITRKTDRRKAPREGSRAARTAASSSCAPPGTTWRRCGARPRARTAAGRLRGTASADSRGTEHVEIAPKSIDRTPCATQSAATAPHRSTTVEKRPLRRTRAHERAVRQLRAAAAGSAQRGTRTKWWDRERYRARRGAARGAGSPPVTVPSEPRAQRDAHALSRLADRLRRLKSAFCSQLPPRRFERRFRPGDVLERGIVTGWVGMHGAVII